MPYTVKTKDGITIRNIPDTLAPDSEEVRAWVAKARAERPAATQHATNLNPGVQAANLINPAPPVKEEPSTTAAGVLGSVNRALLPYAGGAALGAAIGAPIGGVGAAPGAVAGIGAVGLSKLVGDPIVGTINRLFGTTYTLPTDALEDLMTKLGLPEPRTQAERIVRTAFEAAAGAGSQVALGRALVGAASSPTVRGVGEALSSQPVAQIASGGGAGIAAQAAKEAGAGPVGQIVAGLGGSIVGGAPFVRKPLGVPRELAEGEAAMQPRAVQEGAPVAPVPVQKVTEPTPQLVGELVKKASGTGMKSTAAKNQLADMAAINLDAKQAAERRGFDLPADVFSDNPQIRAAAGLTRSAAGSPAEGAWRTTVTNAVDKADEVMRGFDATFAEGQVSPGVVSEKVRDVLQRTRAGMNAEARKIYDQVDAAVPKATQVKLPKVEETLVKILDEVGPEGLSTQEKKLLKMVDSEEGVTYGRLIREKNLMGQALAGKDSPYGNMEAASLKRLYGALAEDQLAAVESAGGGELRQQLHGANLLYAKERALGKRIIAAFGEDFEGSLANKMRTAITDSSKGGSADFVKLMKTVPDDLKREVVATALASATRSARGAEAGGFGFSEYAKVYRGLRANAPVYKQVVDALGPGSHEVLQDLYVVSKRITDARANVLTTGKANQALSQAIRAEGLVEKVLDSTVAHGLATGASAAGLGPLGATFTASLMKSLTNGRKQALEAAGELFADEAFQKLLTEAATQPRVRPGAVRTAVNSPAFRRFARVARLPQDPEQRAIWVMNAVRAENSTIQ